MLGCYFSGCVTNFAYSTVLLCNVPFVENMDSVLKLQGEAIDSLTNQVEVAHR